MVGWLVSVPLASPGWHQHCYVVAISSTAEPTRLLPPQDLRRCLPLVLQALRALLRFLVAVDLSARLQLRLPKLAAAAPGGPSSSLRVVQAAHTQPWRVKCAELLASVLSELAGLKVRERACAGFICRGRQPLTGDRQHC